MPEPVPGMMEAEELHLNTKEWQGWKISYVSAFTERHLQRRLHLGKMSTSFKPVHDKLPEVGRHRKAEETKAAVSAALPRQREHNRAKTHVVAYKLEPVLKRGAGSSTD